MASTGEAVLVERLRTQEFRLKKLEKLLDSQQNHIDKQNRLLIGLASMIKSLMESKPAVQEKQIDPTVYRFIESVPVTSPPSSLTLPSTCTSLPSLFGNSGSHSQKGSGDTSITSSLSPTTTKGASSSFLPSSSYSSPPEPSSRQITQSESGTSSPLSGSAKARSSSLRSHLTSPPTSPTPEKTVAERLKEVSQKREQNRERTSFDIQRPSYSQQPEPRFRGSQDQPAYSSAFGSYFRRTDDDGGTQYSPLISEPHD